MGAGGLLGEDGFSLGVAEVAPVAAGDELRMQMGSHRRAPFPYLVHIRRQEARRAFDRWMRDP